MNSDSNNAAGPGKHVVDPGQASADLDQLAAEKAFGELYRIVKRLRDPDTGCPWDIKQNPKSMRASLIEESYEAVDAINADDIPNIREELGDVYLLATMLSFMHEQDGAFTVKDVLDENAAKLVRRHPHVFGDAEAESAEQVLEQWKVIKETIEGKPKKDSLMDEVSRSLPPLERAYLIQKKAAKAGFDWDKADDVWDKLSEEVEETREACAGADKARIEAELGDVLFSVVNVARFLDIDPMIALHGTIQRFSDRFRHVEKSMKASGLAMGKETVKKMNEYWDEAKANEKV